LRFTIGFPFCFFFPPMQYFPAYFHCALEYFDD